MGGCGQVAFELAGREEAAGAAAGAGKAGGFGIDTERFTRLQRLRERLNSGELTHEQAGEGGGVGERGGWGPPPAPPDPHQHPHQQGWWVGGANMRRGWSGEVAVAVTARESG